MFQTFWEISTGTPALKFSVKLLPANMSFVNYSGLKLSPDFQNTGKLEVFYKSSLSTLMLWWNIWTFAAGLKVGDHYSKITKSCTPLKLFFEEFHYKCRTATLKNASRWLLLGTTLFSKYSSMAAFQRQLQRYIYFRNSRLHMFYISYSDVMLKRNEFLWIFF